jgi:MFS family permease
VRSRGLALAVLCMAAFTINLDTTIVNIALPSLVRQLDASTRELQWIVDAYTLTFASLVLAAGSLSDRYGRKGALLTGLAVFGCATAVGGLVDSPGALIAVRAVMGVGAAVIFPATLSIISNLYTERSERARAIGVWGAMTGLGVALGPVSGGWLLEHFWWGSVFVAMAPVAAVTFLGAAFFVPTSRDPATPPVDVVGLVLSTLAIGTLVFTIIEAPAGAGRARPPSWASRSPPARPPCSSPGSDGGFTRCWTSRSPAACGSPRPAARSW